MPSNELSSDRIKRLYDLFEKTAPYAGWGDSFGKELRWARDLDDAAFRLPAPQEHLWRALGISKIGPGESVNTKGAYADAEIVAAFVAIRERRLPDEPGARSRTLQDAYDAILKLVSPRHTPTRPQAKLARAFTLLFPRDTHTCYSYESARNVAWLILGSRPAALVEGMVLIRQRLRGAIGPEAGLDDDVSRAMFCWWLHENYDVLVRGDDPQVPIPKAPGSDPTLGPIETPKPPPLVLLPAARLRIGITGIGGYLDSYRDVVSAATNGASPDDIVATLRTNMGHGQWSVSTCRQLFNELRSRGFLIPKDGLWFPSESGLRLLAEDPADVLVEKFLTETWGLGTLLRFVKSAPRTRAAMNEHLQGIMPAFGSWQSGGVSGWARSLGLVADDPATQLRTLTDYGRFWEARLPEVLELPTVAAKRVGTAVVEDEGDDDVADTEDEAIVWPEFAGVLGVMRANLPDFVLDEGQLRSLHVAWHCNERKRFVLLSGLSGTGKTALLKQYAHAYTGLCGLDPAEQVAIVAVSPDWRDPTGLLGYHNPLHSEPTWHREAALRLLLSAARHPRRPHFLILDEMNLAQVEHYFAPFLSAMETGEDLRLHEEAELINGVPRSIPWPRNLFIAGTLNMDESTHPVSDKVLDRAFTLEFWEVDLAAFLDKRVVPAATRDLLLDLHGVLAKVRRHFGYRTAGEVLAFAGHPEATPAMLDDAVFAKVLPRLRGEDTTAFRAALQEARARCASAGLVRSAAKLDEMAARLAHAGLARFFA